LETLQHRLTDTATGGGGAVGTGRTLPPAGLLAARAPGGVPAAEQTWVGPISAEAARRLARDAGVLSVLLGATGQPLDIGRASAIWPAAIRRAILVRDGGCPFPGCDRPGGWVEIQVLVR
jgi:hypothetical protein